MPNLKMTKAEIKELLRVDKINEDVLSQNPKYLIILRLNLEMSQNEFEKFLGISKNTYKYETGKIKKMNLSTAKKFLAKTNTIINRDTVLRNFEKFESESKGWIKANSDSEKAYRGRQKGAIKSLSKRRTPQETEIAEYLRKKAIMFEINFPVRNKCIVDFRIGKIILECKRLVTKNRREQKEKIKELAYQGYKIRFYEPKSIVIGLIESDLPLKTVDYEELYGPYDNVFEKIEQLFLYLDQTI